MLTRRSRWLRREILRKRNNVWVSLARLSGSRIFGGGIVNNAHNLWRPKSLSSSVIAGSLELDSDFVLDYATVIYAYFHTPAGILLIMDVGQLLSGQ